MGYAGSTVGCAGSVGLYKVWGGLCMVYGFGMSVVGSTGLMVGSARSQVGFACLWQALQGLNPKEILCGPPKTLASLLPVRNGIQCAANKMGGVKWCRYGRNGCHHWGLLLLWGKVTKGHCKALSHSAPKGLRPALATTACIGQCVIRSSVFSRVF